MHWIYHVAAGLSALVGALKIGRAITLLNSDLAMPEIVAEYGRTTGAMIDSGLVYLAVALVFAALGVLLQRSR
jgi:hypothetical protein